MSDEDTIIADAVVRDRNVFRVTVEDGKTYIRDYMTNRPVFVLNGEIGAGVQTMTTADLAV